MSATRVSKKIISCGPSHCAVITDKKKVFCWGNNQHRECGVPRGLDNVVEVSCGTSHTSALTSTGRIFCWGSNKYGQCDVPEYLENIIQISCGPYFTAALSSTGEVFCWGSNSEGQCNVPRGDLKNFIQISCGVDYVGALTDEGEVVCWGGEIMEHITLPHVRNILEISCGDSYFIGLTVEKEVLCLGGYNDFYNYDEERNENFFIFGNFKNVKQISSSGSNIAVLGHNRRVFCLHENLDIPDSENRNFIQVVCGPNNILAITSSGRVVCWGDGDDDYGMFCDFKLSELSE
jgi:alpha-tubulin suppressor-like RCC1 family protein